MPTLKKPILAEALRLHERGLWVVPCVGKVPFDRDWPYTRNTAEDLSLWLGNGFAGQDLNIGIVLNQTALVDVEADTPEAEAGLQAMFGGAMPKTPTWRSARGPHRLFQRPDGLPDRAVVKLDGVEFRGISKERGALSIVPPSVHPSGGAYEWLSNLRLGDVEPAELPEEIVAITQTKHRSRTSG